MKRIFSLLIALIAFSVQAATETIVRSIPDAAAEVIESPEWPDNYFVSVSDGAYLYPTEPEGHPLMPYTVVEIPLPLGSSVKEVTTEVGSWKELKSGVPVLPIQSLVQMTENPEIPDFVPLKSEILFGGAYPKEAAEYTGVMTKDDHMVVTVKLTPFRWTPFGSVFEQAKDVSIRVTYDTPTTSRIKLATPKLAADEKPLLLILAPEDLYATWTWYGKERQTAHPEVTVEVVNTQTIYADYPYKNVRVPSEGPASVSDTESRYPSESIWKWLVNYREQHPSLKYLILGGAWLDVTDPNVHFLQDGTEITLKNAIPSLRVNPRKDTMNPTDMYYACLQNGSDDAVHHWDANNNGVYIEADGNEEKKCNMLPDIAVSRITAKPMPMNESVVMNPVFERPEGSRIFNQHQLITNFLYKVNAAESKDFKGNHKLAITSSSLNYKTLYLNDSLMQRTENEFFDGAPNMYAPEHVETFRDAGPSMRRHASELTALYRPVLETVSYHEPGTYSKNSSKETFSSVFNSFDRELGTVNGHGWAGGSGWFSANTFSTCTGLTKINVVGVSCETGYLDIYGNQNGKSVANLSLGESGQANATATGGVIASVNNTRIGWSTMNGRTYRASGVSANLHYYMYWGVSQGMNAGDAWKFMCHNYYRDCGNNSPGSTGGQCYTQEMLFGDPLIKLEPIADYAWDGASMWSGVYSNATFTANSSASLAVPTAVGAMSMTVTQPERATFSLTGTGSVKVMRGMTVSGGNLEIGVSGGIGGVGDAYNDKNESENAKRPNHLAFTTPGAITFNNMASDAYFYVPRVSNVTSMTFAGGGAIIDTDDFEGTLETLTFCGKDGFDGKTAPANVIRANAEKNVGSFTRFLPLNLTNTSLTFETYDAFNGFASGDFANLTDSKLTFRANRWRGLTDADYAETIRGTLTLNNSILASDYPASIYLDSPTLNIQGTSSIETTHGGAFKLKGEMKINLSTGSTLTLDGDIQSLDNAAMTITGSGRVIVKNAKGLVGDVRIGEGVTLELIELPLVDVKALTFADGSKVVLPKDGNFYQILPLSSGLFTDEGAKVQVALKTQNEIGESVEEGIDAELTQTGAIFQSGTILAWSDSSGVWSEDQIQRPWIKNGVRSSFSREERAYFPDVKAGSKIVDDASVDVAMAIVSPFTCFANANTAYTFRRSAMESAQNATITFDSLSIGGVTRFELPTFYETRLYVAGGTFVGTEVTTPLIEIAANGSFEATAISTRFEDPSDVLVAKDAALTLSGAHAASFVFASGAKLKAENDKKLIWTDKTTFVFPEGKVIVDVSDFVASDELTPIIAGVKADMAYLRHFETTNPLVSLALNDDGDICLVRVASSADNWLDDCVVTLEGGEYEYDVAAAEHHATITFKTNELNTVLKIVVPARDRFFADEVHLEGVAKAEITDLRLGTGTLYASNETHLQGDTSGVLSMTQNDVVYLHTPTTPWTLAPGFQGKVYVGVTSLARAERQKIFKIDADIDRPIGGFEVYPYDFEQNAVHEGFSIVKEGEWIYLVPPGVKGMVTEAGETAWSALTWYAYDGDVAEIRDWTNIYSAELVSENDEAVVEMNGVPRTILKTSGKKLALKSDSGLTLPRELVVDGELTIRGDILPSLEYVKGEGKLILDTGAVTEIVIPGSVMPIGEANVEIKPGSTLRFAHQAYFQNNAADFSHISGHGTIELKNISSGEARFIMPENKLMFSKDLSFALNTVLELQAVHNKEALEVSNLSGSGSFGYGVINYAKLQQITSAGTISFDDFMRDYGGTRVLETRQTKVSEWKGTLPEWFGIKFFGAVQIYVNSKLVVSGSEETPDISRRLIYSGLASDAVSDSGTGYIANDQEVLVKPSGCFELDGYWNGSINNNGILVIGRRKVIKNSTVFQGNGKIAVLGNKLDLIAYPVFKNLYSLASGTYGEIDFTVTDFSADTEVMSAEANFELSTEGDLMLVAVKDNERQWQKVTSENFRNGKLVWLGASGQGTGEALVFNLTSGENDIDTLMGGQYLGGADNLTVRGTAASDYLDATSKIALFKGVLTLENATVKCVSPMEAKLASNPTGKLVFVVENTEREMELMKLVEGFTYNPRLFVVEIVDKEGNASDACWTWTAQDGVLKYVLTDPKSSKYMPRAFRFDQNMAGWGQTSTNLGTPTLDKFVISRAGYALTNHNPHGNDFEIGTNDWSVNWVARLSPAVGAVHFSLGNTVSGFALTTVDGSHAAISRWTNSQSATKIISGEVPFATTRFNSYALTYRKGLYTFYINGKAVGSYVEAEGTDGYPEKVNWQLFSIHGGAVGDTTNGAAGAIDDFRLYNVALGEKMIREIADEFPPWPDKINANGDEIYRDVNQDLTNLFIEGEGTIHLTREKGANGIANLIGIEGTAALVIEDGVELIVEMSSINRTPLAGHDVTIKKGGRLVLKQTDDMASPGLSDAQVRLSNIKGTGTLEFRSAKPSFTLKLPSSRKSQIVGPRYWAESLSVCINTQIQLPSSYTQTSALVLRNLSGNGTFVQQGGNTGEARYIDVVQSERTTFTGKIPNGTTLTVVGEGDTPDRNAALVVDPVSPLPQGATLKAAANGTLALKSAANLKNVTIIDEGLVIFEPEFYETIELSAIKFAANSSGNRIALSGAGKLVVANSTGFVLESNPLGTLVLENGATIRVADGFTFSPIAFRVSVDGRAATAYVENGVLKARVRPIPKILFR